MVDKTTFHTNLQWKHILDHPNQFVQLEGRRVQPSMPIDWYEKNPESLRGDREASITSLDDERQYRKALHEMAEELADIFMLFYDAVYILGIEELEELFTNQLRRPHISHVRQLTEFVKKYPQSIGKMVAMVVGDSANMQQILMMMRNTVKTPQEHAAFVRATIFMNIVRTRDDYEDLLNYLVDDPSEEYHLEIESALLDTRPLVNRILYNFDRNVPFVKRFIHSQEGYVAYFKCLIQPLNYLHRSSYLIRLLKLAPSNQAKHLCLDHFFKEGFEREIEYWNLQDIETIKTMKLLSRKQLRKINNAYHQMVGTRPWKRFWTKLVSPLKSTVSLIGKFKEKTLDVLDTFRNKMMATKHFWKKTEPVQSSSATVVLLNALMKDTNLGRQQWMGQKKVSGIESESITQRFPLEYPSSEWLTHGEGRSSNPVGVRQFKPVVLSIVPEAHMEVTPDHSKTPVQQESPSVASYHFAGLATLDPLFDSANVNEKEFDFNDDIQLDVSERSVGLSNSYQEFIFRTTKITPVLH